MVTNPIGDVEASCLASASRNRIVLISIFSFLRK